MILQRIRIIVGDAGFEPGTSAPEVWWAKPPHLLYLVNLRVHNYQKIIIFWVVSVCIPFSEPDAFVKNFSGINRKIQLLLTNEKNNNILNNVNL